MRRTNSLRAIFTVLLLGACSEQSLVNGDRPNDSVVGGQSSAHAGAGGPITASVPSDAGTGNGGVALYPNTSLGGQGGRGPLATSAQAGTVIFVQTPYDAGQAGTNAAIQAGDFAGQRGTSLAGQTSNSAGQGGVNQGGASFGGQTATAGAAGQACNHHGECPNGEFCFHPSLAFSCEPAPATATSVGSCHRLTNASNCLDQNDLCACLSPAERCAAGTVCGSVSNVRAPSDGCYGCKASNATDQPSQSIGAAGAAGTTNRAGTATRCRVNSDCEVPYSICYVPYVVDNCQQGPLGYCSRSATVHCGTSNPSNASACMVSSLALPVCPQLQIAAWTGADTRCVSCMPQNVAGAGGLGGS